MSDAEKVSLQEMYDVLDEEAYLKSSSQDALVAAGFLPKPDARKMRTVEVMRAAKKLIAIVAKVEPGFRRLVNQELGGKS